MPCKLRVVCMRVIPMTSIITFETCAASLRETTPLIYLLQRVTQHSLSLDMMVQDCEYLLRNAGIADFRNTWVTIPSEGNKNWRPRTWRGNMRLKTLGRSNSTLVKTLLIQRVTMATEEGGEITVINKNLVCYGSCDRVYNVSHSAEEKPEKRNLNPREPRLVRKFRGCEAYFTPEERCNCVAGRDVR